MTETTTVQLRPSGTLTLPRAVREKYGLADGDAVEVVDLDGVLLLVPKELAVLRLAGEMEKLRRKARVSLKALGGPAREDRAAARTRRRILGYDMRAVLRRATAERR